MENAALELGALGFWIFLAAVSVAGIWDGTRKRDAQHETLRRALQHNPDLDAETIDKLVSIGEGSGRPDRDFKVTALWVLPVSPGVAVLGYFVGIQSEEAFYPMMGVAALLAVLSAGFWLAGSLVSNWYNK